MKIRKPNYYDKFQCIAGACGDSCCIGWEIDIDEERKAAYAKVPGELGERLRRCIDWEENHFILQGKEERCPFLNQDNLCDLIIGLGEDSLCDICREHPRFYDWFDDVTEVGVGLCCEAAGRLILGQKEPVFWLVDKVEDEAQELQQGEDCAVDVVEELLFEARDTAVSILQNRKKSIWERLRLFLGYVEELQDALDFGDLKEMEELAAGNRKTPDGGTEKVSPSQKAEIYAGILKLCRELEAIDESWHEALASLERLVSCPEQFAALEHAMMKDLQEREYEYEQLAVYFVYRYFMKSREDEDIRSRGKLTVFCILLVHLLDVDCYREAGRLTTEKRVQNAKCCSKEIEYSEENLEQLADAFWERNEVSAERLSLLLSEK